jgi:hypothetical protein
MYAAGPEKEDPPHRVPAAYFFNDYEAAENHKQCSRIGAKIAKKDNAGRFKTLCFKCFFGSLCVLV